MFNLIKFIPKEYTVIQKAYYGVSSQNKDTESNNKYSVNSGGFGLAALTWLHASKVLLLIRKYLHWSQS